MYNELGSSSVAQLIRLNGKPERMSDDGLVELIRLGNHEAFAILRVRHEKRLLGTAIRILRNREDGEDALQESFLKAYRHIATFNGKSAVSTWLTRIVINTCLMQLRKQRTRPSVSLDEPNEHGLSRCDAIPDRAINIEASYVVRERRELLSIAVSRLKPSLRSVVDAYRQHDYTMAELAKQSGLSIPAAKSRLRRARQALESSPVMAACR